MRAHGDISISQINSAYTYDVPVAVHHKQFCQVFSVFCKKFVFFYIKFEINDTMLKWKILCVY